MVPSRHVPDNPKGGNKVSRRRLVACAVVAVLSIAVVISIVQSNPGIHYDVVSDVESGCSIGGTITHTVSGDTTTISREAELPLLEISSKRKTMLFSDIEGTEYEVKVFHYIASEAYSEYFGKGFVLRFFSEDGRQWSTTGSGVFAFYQPSSDGSKHLEGRTAISGTATGLNFDGSGGHVVAQLEPSSEDAVLAARYSLDLVIECPRL